MVKEYMVECSPTEHFHAIDVVPKLPFFGRSWALATGYCFVSNTGHPFLVGLSTEYEIDVF